MPSSPVSQRALARIARLCTQPQDGVSVRIALLAELHRVIDFDSYVWVLTDPETCVGAAPLADVPCLPELPTLIRLKYLTRVNRWTTLRRGDVALLHENTAGDLSRSLVWQELLAAYDVRDIASCAFQDRFGVWGFLDLWRTGPSRPFTPGEVQVLSDAMNNITTALRRAQAATFTPHREDQHWHTGAVVLLLSPALEVLAQTPETQEFLAGLLPPAENRPPIPAIAYNVAAQLLANEAGADDHPAFTRVHFADGQWLTLRAARIGDHRQGAQGDIAVTIEQSTPADRLAVFAAGFGLTARETELLKHLATGRDTRDIAAGLYVSEHTVHDHLKSMFAKTGMRSRGAMVSAALGAPPTPNADVR